MKTILIVALFLILCASGCGGYGHKGKSPGGGTTTSGSGY